MAVVYKINAQIIMLEAERSFAMNVARANELSTRKKHKTIKVAEKTSK